MERKDNRISPNGKILRYLAKRSNEDGGRIGILDKPKMKMEKPSGDIPEHLEITM